MPASSKSQAFKLVFAHEGGYVNHPKDPGGATNLGVTQAVYDAWRKRQGLPKRSVRLITKAEATAIYEGQYWTRIDADELPAGLDYAVYDYAVNSGPSRAVKDLQRVLSARGRPVGIDGVMGLKTLAAVCAEAAKDEEGLIADYCERRLAFMRSLRTWKTFGVGWQRRVQGRNLGAQDKDDGVVDYAIRMARADKVYGGGKVDVVATKDLPQPIGVHADENAGKANESDQAVTKTGVGIAGAVAAVATGGQEIIPDVVDKLTPAADNEHVARIIHALLLAAALIAIAAVLVAYARKMRERAEA